MAVVMGYILVEPAKFFGQLSGQLQPQPKSQFSGFIELGIYINLSVSNTDLRAVLANRDLAFPGMLKCISNQVTEHDSGGHSTH